MVLPGATHAVPDSHASTVGGLGALAFGCGTTELAHILATQVIAMKRPKSMRIRLDGTLGAARHRQGRGAAASSRSSAWPAGAATWSNMPATWCARCRSKAAHDAVQSQHRDGRPLGLRGAGRRRPSPGSRAGRSRRRARSGTRRSRIGARSRATTTRTFDTEHTHRLRRARAADHLGHRSEPGGRHHRPRARSGVRPEPPRDRWKARSPIWASRPARRSRACRSIACSSAPAPMRACPTSRPPPTWCAGATSPRRRRPGGAGLVDGEARGRGQGPRQRVPRRRLRLGRIRLLDVRRRQWRPRRAGRAHRLHHQPQFREPPGPEDAHASREPRDRGRERGRRPHHRRAQLWGAA